MTSSTPLPCVVVSCFAGWHGFDLAQALYQSGLLETVVCLPSVTDVARRTGIPLSRIRRLPGAALLHRLEWFLAERGPRWLRDLYFDAFCAYYDWFTSRWLTSTTRVLVGWYPYVLRSQVIARRRGIKTVWDVGSTHPLVQRQLLEQAYQAACISLPWTPRRVLASTAALAAADRIFVPSSVVADSYRQMGFSDNQLIQVPYGADTAFFTPGDRTLPPSAFTPEQPLEVLFVAGLCVRKGGPLLLELARSLEDQPIRFTVLGSVEREMQWFLEKTPSNLRILPAGDRERLRDFYRRSHLLLLPSVEEGLARVMLEAIACGLPVAATAATGFPDLLAQGAVGFVLGHPLATCTAALLHSLLKDPSPLTQMRQSAVALELSQQRYGRRIRECYLSLVKCA